MSYVLSSDQLNKSFSSLCLQNFVGQVKYWSLTSLNITQMISDKNFVSVGYGLNTQARGRIIGVSKTLCDFGHKNSFTEE